MKKQKYFVNKGIKSVVVVMFCIILFSACTKVDNDKNSDKKEKVSTTYVTEQVGEETEPFSDSTSKDEVIVETQEANQTRSTTEALTQAPTQAPTQSNKDKALALAIELNEKNRPSKTDLKKSLSHTNYSSDDIEYAIDNCGADWNSNAVYWANELVSDISSMKMVSNSLLMIGFTQEEADYGANKCRADWYQNAINMATKIRNESYNPSKSIISNSLSLSGFTSSQINYALITLGYR